MAIFLLGADDPEMKAVAALLESKQYTISYATVNGKRAHAGNAYEADPLELPSGELLVCIECRPTSIPRGVNLFVIDHHRPGDPGWGKGPKEYWEASSIGQLHNLLNINPDQAARVLAAMDHCFGAAIRGECPGVTAKEALDCKVRSIAEAHTVSYQLVYEIVDRFRALIRGRKTVQIGHTTVVDMRTTYLGVGYSLDLLTAQVASAIENMPALLCGRNQENGPKRITLYGADSKTIDVFMSTWAQANGLTSIYGAPTRGYAGGLLVG